eukprot:454415-Pleurochrysis_carterae.AAC.1
MLSTRLAYAHFKFLPRADYAATTSVCFCRHVTSERRLPPMALARPLLICACACACAGAGACAWAGALS